MTSDQLEAFEERAAIMEYDGRMSRDKAEAFARLWIKKQIGRESSQRPASVGVDGRVPATVSVSSD